MTTKDDSESVVPSSTDDINNDLQRVFELDRIIHEPARLVILAALSKAEEVDFKFLQMVTGLTKGNLSRQATNLEEAGYIEIRKYYRHKVPATDYRITDTGRRAFARYWDQMAALQQRFHDEDSNHEKEE
ncbi:transcriptional regulator [Dictyobacter sp. S3.2.2.5]|uniref:Transcriptional regulator n=1 Tax=Dictyobacter halimunensis TaxID=3026934 RepID=A0ABQ6G6I4_9CHLR|nr:transcriptional regulator [Dictyobacter sp. S3.2.2.5]